MTHASVFSGIGGPEVAATMLGWENLFHCEINPFGRQVLDYWYPNSESYEDITATDFSEWRGRVDVLTGGFPCQPFSYAGRRRGAEDDRYLWPSMYRAIDEIQPTWVVAENVAGILTMVEQGEVSKVAGTATLFDAFDDLRGRFELRETFTLQRICTDLESHGYAVQPVLVPACAVGAPHRRDRVFIVGHRERPIADTRSNRGSEVDEHVQPEQPNGKEPECVGMERNATDTDGIMLGARDNRGIEDGSPADRIKSFRGKGASGIVGEAWSQFPSVKPAICRRDDGIPYPLDSLSLCYSKYRVEALKAYGNAIVPQVMYEIFRAIEIVEQQNNEL